jgi:catechol 2,3-dioxygenase-like lactoylglutathione lyase family enzyme
MVETFGLTHIAPVVQHAERAFRFYQDIFGTVAVYRKNGFIQAQTPGRHDVLVFEKKLGRAPGSGGIAHLGSRLVDPADIDEAVRAVERAGGGILSRGEFCPGEPYVFCRDPDDYQIEIWHEPPTAADPAPPAARAP